MSALMKAINQNNAAEVQELIVGGADVDELESNGDAPKGLVFKTSAIPLRDVGLIFLRKEGF